MEQREYHGRTSHWSCPNFWLNKYMLGFIVLIVSNRGVWNKKSDWGVWNVSRGKNKSGSCNFFVMSTLKMSFHLLPSYNELKSIFFRFNSALNFLPNIPFVFAFNVSEMNVDYPLQPYFLDQSYPYWIRYLKYFEQPFSLKDE